MHIRIRLPLLPRYLAYIGAGHVIRMHKQPDLSELSCSALLSVCPINPVVSTFWKAPIYCTASLAISNFVRRASLPTRTLKSRINTSPELA